MSARISGRQPANKQYQLPPTHQDDSEDRWTRCCCPTRAMSAPLNGEPGKGFERQLLKQFDVHILRLPTGIFYAQGVKSECALF